ncbi:MAG: S-layer homology domain-containing protein [Paenibacillaceae bacterium]
MHIMYKKGISIILVMLMVLGGLNGLFIGGGKAYAAVSFEGGTGTLADPYQIATADQLNEVRNHMSASFKLTADIDLNVSPYNVGAGWQPIGNGTSMFQGNMDGNGYKITNLMINSPGTDYIGLFGGSSGSINKIILENISVTGGSYTGGLVGYGFSTISNSSVSGSVTGQDNTGGLVGYNYGMISNSFVSGSVTGRDNIGGLVGMNYSGGISSSYAVESVNGNNYVGGLAGTNYVTISASYASGQVINNTGVVNVLVGIGETISGGSSFISDAQMKDKNTFSSWDFNTVWYIIPGQYPQLWTFTALTPGTDGGTIKLNHVVAGMEYSIGSANYVPINDTSVDNINVNVGNAISVHVAADTTSAISLTASLTNIKPAAAPTTAALTVGTDTVGATHLTGVTSAMEYKVNSDPYTPIGDTSVDNIPVEVGDQIYVRVMVTSAQPASLAQVLNVGSGDIKTGSITPAAIVGVTVPETHATPVSSITSTAQYAGTVAWSPSLPTNGRFAEGEAYTANITLIPRSGYSYIGLSSNSFTVAGASTTTFSASNGVVTAVFPATTAVFAGGTGAVDNPYSVATAAQLNRVRDFLNDSFKLTANIDLSSYNWIPLGDWDQNFGGNFDGNGFTIKNLTINRPNAERPNAEPIGLFGYIGNTNSVMTNIILENINVIGGNYVGGLAGENDGRINNSYASGSVSGTDYVGGLAGYNYGTISSSYASGSVTGNSYVGGLVGANYGPISGSYAIGSVSGSGNIGGLVGFNDSGIIISSSVFDLTTTRQPDTGNGTGKLTLDMQNLSTYSDLSWDFAGTWGINSSTNNGYPYLQVFKVDLTYNGNGNNSGSVPIDNTIYLNGVTANVYGNTGNLIKTGYTFAGWNTLADGSGTNYAAEEALVMTGNKTLFAKWTITSSSDGCGNCGSSPTTSSTPTPTPTPTPTATPTPTPTPLNIFKSGIVNDAKEADFIRAMVDKVNNSEVKVELKDTTGHWAEKTIDTFVKLGVIQGYGDKSFKPDANITRAEFATILTKVFSMDTGTKSTNLKDLGTHWAKAAIEKLASLGIISGYGDGTFKPDRTISREEMIVIISRIVNLTPTADGANNSMFTDIDGSYAKEALNDAAKVGIISGKGDNKMEPKSNATRGEALTILLNTLNLNPQLKTLLGGLK